MAKKELWRNRIVGYGEEAPEQLLANEANWRIHPKSQQDALSGSLREIGVVQNIIVNRRSGEEWPDGKRGVSTVVDGHARISIAISENQKSLPITYVELSPSEESYILATLDPIGAMAAADKEKLDELLRQVKSGEAGIQQMLAELAEKNGLIKQEEADAEPQIDKAKELQEKWGTKTGDLWRINDHRLLCGDSTKREDVERVMAGEKADMCFTDPPYNVGKDYGLAVNDAMSSEDYAAWSAMWFANAESCSDAIAFTPGAVNLWMWAAMRQPKWMAIWVKKNQVSRNAAGGFNTYEPVLCYGKVKVDYDSWDIPVKQENVAHPVPKTVRAWSQILGDLLHGGTIVYDPFCGSGTTMVACENLGRQCRAIEISQEYCAVILQRMTDAFPGVEIERE